MTLRKKIGGKLVEGVFKNLSHAARLHPQMRRALNKLRVQRDIPYQTPLSAEHTLDVYRPRGEGPWPAFVYIHGGGFRILSKDTHWALAMRIARQGFVVFNVNYRLAPQHPFPAAVHDVHAAWQWILDHGGGFNADMSQVLIGGESAGANLSLGLTLSACFERPEPWARAVYERGRVPAALTAFCGLFQVSDMARFGRRKTLPTLIQDRMVDIESSYLAQATHDDPRTLELADPVSWLEAVGAQQGRPSRPLPPCFAPVGTADPLLDDTRRLKAAWDALGGRCEARYYPKEVHAFQAFLWRPNAQQCWRDTFEFIRDATPIG